jgi:hypothetical protein
MIALPVSQAPLTPSVPPDNPQPKSKGKGKVKGKVKGKGKALLANSQPPKPEPLPPDVTSAAEYSWDEPPPTLTPEVEELATFFESDYDKAKRAVLDFSPDSYTSRPQEISQQLQHIYHNTKVTEHNVAVAGFRRRFSLYMLSNIHENLKETLKERGGEETAMDNMLRDIYKHDDLKEKYKAKKRRLKYRLKAGGRWQQLVSVFGVGILALPGERFPQYQYGSLAP